MVCSWSVTGLSLACSKLDLEASKNFSADDRRCLGGIDSLDSLDSLLLEWRNDTNEICDRFTHVIPICWGASAETVLVSDSAMLECRLVETLDLCSLIRLLLGERETERG